MITDPTPEEIIQELAVLVRQQVGDIERCHYMVSLLSILSAQVFLFRMDLQEARDLAAEVVDLPEQKTLK